MFYPIESRLGPLRSAMELTLHTFHAVQIWQGRAASEEKTAIIGFGGFLGAIRNVTRGAEQGDPYADLWMLRIQEKLQRCKAELALIQDNLELLMRAFPDAISAEENFSIRPVRLPIVITTQFGYLAMYLLITYDNIVRRLLHAYHVALIDRREMESRIHAGGRLLRGLFGFPRRYRHSGATRVDFAYDNDQARQARKLFGELPMDVLDGTRRADFAPPLVRDRVIEEAGDVVEQLPWLAPAPKANGYQAPGLTTGD
ncbi:integrating conjugative element protein, PFL_4669 family [Pseudomonas asplenii]|uniref:Integrating conjugative element protein, PFL_4669 family n=1 Tax=Pseudomonas asplenii TaxID=53407 RepID=A0A0N1J5W1_9PSED|nr:TIGR03761 family integrating conjugative element protein [Pseudomonas fuscovaginae]KPA90085.1 integrating conjugative element protein, PFL_4669 family [Pseudomonas fuscovaginae]